MKVRSIAAAMLAIGVISLHTGASAQFGLKNPLASNNNAAPSANAGEVMRNTRDSMLSFAKAELGLSQALGGYADLAAQQKLLEGMKSGDVAAKKEDFETIVTIHKSANELIEKKASENAAIDANNKALAGKSMVDYVKGLASTRKLIASVQGLAKNPMSLAGDAGSVMYVAKEVPGIASGAVSTTGKLMKYLGSNGVDMTEAKKAADGMEK